MPKTVLWAGVHVPQYPRVRFFSKSTGPQRFEDITARVARLVAVDLEESSGAFELQRLDASGQLVWKTRHPSLQELKWHAEFEYGLPEEKWLDGIPPGA